MRDHSGDDAPATMPRCPQCRRPVELIHTATMKAGVVVAICGWCPAMYPVTHKPGAGAPLWVLAGPAKAAAS